MKGEEGGETSGFAQCYNLKITTDLTNRIRENTLNNRLQLIIYAIHLAKIPQLFSILLPALFAIAEKY